MNNYQNNNLYEAGVLEKKDISSNDISKKILGDSITSLVQQALNPSVEKASKENKYFILQSKDAKNQNEYNQQQAFNQKLENIMSNYTSNFELDKESGIYLSKNYDILIIDSTPKTTPENLASFHNLPSKDIIIYNYNKNFDAYHNNNPKDPSLSEIFGRDDKEQNKELYKKILFPDYQKNPKKFDKVLDKVLENYYPAFGDDYFTVPANFQVSRVSQDAIGYGVLGRTWLGTGVIEVVDHLQGKDFFEVLTHEVLHQIYPDLNERQIREKTRERLDFMARWN